MISQDEMANSTCIAVSQWDIHDAIAANICVGCECFECETAKDCCDCKLEDCVGEYGADKIEEECESCEGICYTCSQYKSRVPCDGFRCEGAIEEIRHMKYMLANCLTDEWFRTRKQQRAEIKDCVKGLRHAMNTGIYQTWDW